MTSRCKTTGKVIYKSKAKADRALGTIRTHSTQADTMHAYRCEDQPSHWHFGHDSKLPGADSGTGEQVAQSRPPRWNSVEWDAASMTLWARARDLCEAPVCGKPLNGTMERHHRQRRAIGGDRLSNLLALHPGCHQWITEHPAEARDAGVIVSAYAPDPAAVPLLTPDGTYVLLTDDGTKEPHRP